MDGGAARCSTPVADPRFPEIGFIPCETFSRIRERIRYAVPEQLVRVIDRRQTGERAKRFSRGERRNMHGRRDEVSANTRLAQCTQADLCNPTAPCRSFSLTTVIIES